MRVKVLRLLAIVIVTFVSLVVQARWALADTHANTFAIVVTNNRSVRLSRPDLRYADDDGAKYYEVFRMISPESNVRLLTKFDHDTEKLFPHLTGKARMPSRAELFQAAKDLAGSVKAARAAGPTHFYFVFAGHGDIDQGKGFLELSDSPFTSDDLELLLTTVGATRSHVILDSCNSFFVINARKPGGRHFVTSQEATKNLSERLPNVGVFLSTSAAAEVYEWSELQSGIFSHAVRSGLMGAADANGDGDVSYSELRAFVNIASSDIKNPNFRPQVFARGPGGRDADSLFDLRQAVGRKIVLGDRAQRLTIRDQDEIPWVDFHKEAGQAATLTLPVRAAMAGSVDITEGTRALQRYGLASNDASTVDLGSLAPVLVAWNGRGPDDMFRRLFSQPFGMRALAQYDVDFARQEPSVFGVSEDDKIRMQALLEQGAARAETQRYVATVGYAGMGLVTIGSASYLYARDFVSSDKPLGIGMGVFGLALLGTAVGVALVPSSEERMNHRFRSGIQSANPMNTVQQTETDLFNLAARERTYRMLSRYVGLGTSALGIAMLGYAAAAPKNPKYLVPLMGGTTAVIGAISFVGSFIKSPAEQTAELWANDPSLQRLPRTTGSSGLSIRPEFGLGQLGIVGSF